MRLTPGARSRACPRRYRNQDGEAVPSDTALFVRDTAACPNKLMPKYTPPASPTPSPTATTRPTSSPAPSTTASATPAPTTTLNHKDAVVNAIVNSPSAQALENHVTEFTSALNALP